ncbi:hypothetical protein [Burkholderia seminalis]|uniref:hypothetical protein n=1 Tax=Burkholderia seminalis TaxID=488731 RepID=UPI0015890754|nr:hypothetical protein [Burkholderia seminalis]
MADLFIRNQQWIAEAESAILDVDPDAATVVSANRSFAVPDLGSEGVLFAQLADGSEWRIAGNSAHRLTADEITDRNRSRESFL